MASKVRGFDNVNVGNDNRDNAKLEDLFEMFTPASDAKGEFVSLRFLSTPILPVKRHWVQIRAGKEKKTVGIPVVCVAFDPDSSDPLKDADGKSIECPYCKLPHGKKEEGFPAQEEVKYLANVIVRDIQDNAPKKQPEPTKEEKKSGFKDIKSKTYTPVRVITMPAGVTRRLRDLGSRNIPKKNPKTGADGKTAYPINDDKFGIDIDIRYNPKAAGAEKYTVEKGEDRTPLSKEEKGYLVWDLENWESLYDALGRMSEKEAKEKLKRLDIIGVSPEEGDDDDDDDDNSRSLGKSGKSGKTKRRIDDDDDDDDDDSGKSRRLGKKDKSTKKSKLSSKKSKKSDDDDDDDDDDKPKKSKLSSKKSKLSSKKSKKTDDDDDDDDDRPSRLGKTKTKSGSKTKVKSKKR
jgi:hypothetical protein